MWRSTGVSGKNSLYKLIALTQLGFYHSTNRCKYDLLHNTTTFTSQYIIMLNYNSLSVLFDYTILLQDDFFVT